MSFVTDCPKSLSEVKNVSAALGCGKDKYENDQYLCLPNVEKSSLVEICYGEVIGMNEKGKTFFSLLKHTYKYALIYSLPPQTL